MPSKPEAILSYEEAKRLAFTGDLGERLRVARSAGVAPEILFKLSTDAVDSVRATVAVNAGLPEQALPPLAEDAAESVRLATVEAVITRVTASLGSLSAALASALDKLASDASTAIRTRLSEGLAASPHTPPSIAERLARDAEAAVATPMLHESPVIVDAVLVDILTTTDKEGIRTAIASRAELSAEVIDAIVVDAISEDDMALTTIPQNTAYATHQHRAYGLYQRQELTESVILEAIQQKDRLFLISALALLAQTREAKVKKMFALQSGKAITALAWKAGLSASAAYALQVQIAGIAPRQAVAPRHGDYALSPSDLEWQLELFDSLVA